MSCIDKITNGITLNCSDINAAIGVDKDLILINYDEIDIAATKADSNREADDTKGNQGGLKTIIQKAEGMTQYVFEGTDYSVQPNVTAEKRDDGQTWYIHSILFTIYNKTAIARKTIENLGRSKVVAITKDRSTGLYEVFGLDIGLDSSTVERPYTGDQSSNFYKVTLATPDIAIIRESTLGEMVTALPVSPAPAPTT